MREIVKSIDEFVEMLTVIQEAEDDNVMLGQVIEKIRSVIDNERCSLFLLDKETKTLHAKYAQECISNLVVPVDKNSIAGYCALTGKEIVIKDVSNEKELKSIDPELSFAWSLAIKENGFQPKQLMCIPIKHRGVVVGVFEAFNKPGGFIDRNLDVMRDFAILLGVCINRILASDELKRIREERAVSRP